LAEEEAEKQQIEERFLADINLLKLTRRGEPTRFEQAAGEVYAWWALPAEIKAQDIKVKALYGGTKLTVTCAA